MTAFEDAQERMLRAFREDPLYRVREEIGRNAMAEIERQNAVARAVANMPVFTVQPDILETWAKANAQFQNDVVPLQNALQAFGRDMLAVSEQVQRWQETHGRQIGEQLQLYERDLKRLGGPLTVVAKQLEEHGAAIARVFANADLDQWQQFTVTARGLAAHYRKYAEASGADRGETASVMAMAQVLEEVEPSQAPDPAVVAMLVHALVSLMMHLAKNTQKRIANMDVIEIILIVVALQQLQPAYTAKDRQRDDHTAQLVQHAADHAKDVATKQAEQQAYIASLPRAVVTGAGRIREAPAQSTQVRHKLPPGTEIAIAETRGRWAYVAFHDQLTDETVYGWMWRGSIEELN